MSTKQIKIQDANGDTFTINAPADATNEEIQAWINGPEGTRAAERALQQKKASLFSNERLRPETEKMPASDAYLGQAKHELNKVGSNAFNFMDKYSPLGVGKDIVDAIRGEEATAATEKALADKLAQGEAFVKETKDQGYSNVGGAGVQLGVGALGMLAPPLQATRFPFLANTFNQARIQALLAGATADEGERGDQALLAGAGSAGGDLAVGALARAAKPLWGVSDEAKLLADKGIYASPLSASGPTMKALEDKLMSVPAIGDTLATGRRGGIIDYNKYVLQDAVGQPLQGPGYGREGFDEAIKIFGKRYDDNLNGMYLDINDPQIQSAFNSVVRNNELDKDGIKTVNRAWNVWRDNHNQGSMKINGKNPNKVQPAGTFGPTTLIDGPQIQKLTQHMADRGNRFGRSTNPYHQNTGTAFTDGRDALLDAVVRQNHGLQAPDKIAGLKQTNKDYARFVPVMEAANRAAASRRDGIFSPAEMSSALKGVTERRRFVSGKAHNQDLHDAANSVFGGAYPDSGTAGRLAVTSMLFGGGGYGLNQMLESDSMMAYAPLATVMGYVAATAPKGARKYALGKFSPKQEAISNALKDNRFLRPGVSALGAALNTDD